MSEQEYQPELDDELLSAYLDDELSVEERAAVEARLANDPDAQQLLHQLHSVSQSVQRLPLEGVGRDLSGEILRRVEAKKRGGGGADRSGSAPIGDVTPRLTVFGSRRSWVWATLALAAGLMIMVLDRGQEKGTQLPAVAQNDRESAEGSATTNGAAGNRTEPLVSSTNAPAANGNVDVSKMARFGTPRSPNVVGEASPSAAAPVDSKKFASRDLALPPSGSVASTGMAASERPAAGDAVDNLHKSPMAAGGSIRPQDGAPLGAHGEAKRAIALRAESNGEPRPQHAASESGIAAAKPAELDQSGGGQAEIEDPNPLVVVHISAKPAAIRGGEFEKLLARNGVEFDTNGKAEEASTTGDSFKESASRSLASRDASHQARVENKPVDVVVVDAPRDVVAACMADLQEDESNFASVEVDQPTASEKAAPATTEVAKQLGSELRQYNRGMIADKQSPRNQNYAYEAKNKDRAQLNDESNRPGSNIGSTPSGASQNQRAAQKNRGRALRLQVSRDDDQSLRDAPFDRRGAGFGGGGGEVETVRQNVGERQKAQNENSDEVRVLFMLSTETAAPASTKKAGE